MSEAALQSAGTLRRNWEWPLLLGMAVLFVALHAGRLAAPPIDAHAWRQATNLAANRAYACGEADLFHPRTDACGGQLTPMELPFYAWVGAKLGAVTTPWVGARLLVLASGAAAVVGLGLLALWLFGAGRSDGSRALLVIGAGGAVIGGPLLRHWLGALMPDPTAWGGLLLGTGLLLHLEGRLARAGASLLTGLAVATKAVVAPALSLGCLALWLAPAPRRDRPGALVHAILGVLPAALWYGLWNPHLASLTDCDMNVLAPQTGLFAAWLNPDAWTALPGHLKEATGWLAPLALVGLFGAGRLGRLPALGIAVTGVGGFWLIATLGWHPLAHEYDGLVWLVPVSLCTAAGLVWLWERFGDGRGPTWRWAVPAAALLVLAVFSGDPAERLEPHSGPIARAGNDLARVVGAGPVDLRLNHDPRLAYFGGLVAWPTPKDGRLCRGQHKSDCAVWQRPAPGPGSICRGGPGTLHVYFPVVQVHCGLQNPDTGETRARLLAATSHVFEQPLELTGGRALALDYREDLMGTSLDLYLEVTSPKALPRGVPVGIDGALQAFEVRGGHRQVQPGAIIVLRRRLTTRADALEALFSGQTLHLSRTGGGEPLPWRCPGVSVRGDNQNFR